MAPSIAQERSRLAKVDGAPNLRRREQWGAVHNYTRARTVSDPATRVFIHISVTNGSSYNGNDAHARAIEAIGRARFGRSSSNTGISYNRGVMPNGQLYEMQPMGRRGAHTVNNYGISSCTRSGTGCPGRGQSITAPSGNLNYNARAYVICQNVNDPVTDEQIDQLARQIVADYEAGLITRHAAHHPHGHRCVSAKSCPGNRMWARMGDLHDRIHHYLDDGLGEDDMPSAKEVVDELLSRRVEFPDWAGPDGADLYESGTAFTVGGLLTGGYAHGKLANRRNKAVLDLLRAQRPLLDAAAEGAGLSSDQVAEIAQACAEAVPDDLAADVVDEVHDRLDS